MGHNAFTVQEPRSAHACFGKLGLEEQGGYWSVEVVFVWCLTPHACLVGLASLQHPWIRQQGKGDFPKDTQLRLKVLWTHRHRNQHDFLKETGCHAATDTVFLVSKNRPMFDSKPDNWFCRLRRPAIDWGALGRSAPADAVRVCHDEVKVSFRFICKIFKIENSPPSSMIRFYSLQIALQFAMFAFCLCSVDMDLCEDLFWRNMQIICP